MRTPQAVKDAAKFFLSEKWKLVHIGEYEGYEVYDLCANEIVNIGYPIVYLYKEGEPVLEIQYNGEILFGVSVFEIRRAAAKNTRDRRKAARLTKKKTPPMHSCLLIEIVI